MSKLPSHWGKCGWCLSPLIGEKKNRKKGIPFSISHLEDQIEISFLYASRLQSSYWDMQFGTENEV